MGQYSLLNKCSKLKRKGKKKTKKKRKTLLVQYALLNNAVKTSPSIFQDILLFKCRNLKAHSFTCTTLSRSYWEFCLTVKSGFCSLHLVFMYKGKKMTILGGKYSLTSSFPCSEKKKMYLPFLFVT